MTTAVAPTKPSPAPVPRNDEPQRWAVVLLDDQDHTYEYVMRMMMELFGHGPQRAFEVAKRVDKDGRAVCLVTHKEHAELKRDQIHAYGKDPLIMGCKGSMGAIIEPAMEDPDEGGPDGNGSSGGDSSGGKE